jgi:hypothetical protein
MLPGAVQFINETVLYKPLLSQQNVVLIENISVVWFFKTVVIPIDTKCAPLLVDLLFYSKRRYQT